MASYERVNGAWPETVPPLTGPEAIVAVRRLYRKALGRRFKGRFKLTSGRRYTWARSGIYYVNPEGHFFGGWRDLVHDVSHLCHRKLHPRQRPHGGSHAWLEKELVEHVVSSGWLEGKLKRPEKPKPNLKAVRADAVARRIAAWERRRLAAERALGRADRALKKLNRSAARYEAVLNN